MPAGATRVEVEGGIPRVTVPPFDKSFRPGKVRAIAAEVLKAKLHNETYDADRCSVLCREIADDVKAKLHELGLERYKLCVQVVVGEQKGAGVRMGCRCFWDPKTDGYAEQMYHNESLYAVAFVAGIYLY